MVFKHTVIHDGVLYPAGTNVPVGIKTEEPKAEVKEEKVESVIIEEPKEAEETPKEKPFKYTKSQVNKMTYAEVKELARDYDDLDITWNCKKLKNAIIRKFFCEL